MSHIYFHEPMQSHKNASKNRTSFLQWLAILSLIMTIMVLFVPKHEFSYQN